MIEPIPSVAKCPYQAFALSPEDAAEARRLAALQVARDAGWRKALVVWFERERERHPDLRQTPLDPRLGRVVERLRVRAVALGEDGEALAQAIAGWSGEPREVFAEAEAEAMNRALRTERLLELDAPAIILESELTALARAIAGLRSPPPPTPVPHEEDDRELVDVPDAIVQRARYDLSLGLHSETVRVLEDIARKLGRDLAAPLAGGEPLVTFPELEAAHQASTDDGERMLLARLRFWKVGPSPELLAEDAIALADLLAKVTPTVRAKVTRALDEDTHEDLKGGDFVASAEARLRRIAVDASAAAREGLVVLSEMSQSIDY